MAENWIVPCNIKFFNVAEHFEKSKRVIWKNSFTMKTGDIAYIYIGSPVGEIKYKCQVVSDKVSEEILEQNSYAIPAKKSNNYFSKKEKYVELELICEFPDGTFPLTTLRENGLGQVQIQARTSRTLQAFIISTENNLSSDSSNS